MSNNDTRVRVLLVDKGIAVAGTDERAVPRGVALSCVRLLQEAGTPILGGDVYYARGAELEPAYANWHSDRSADESEAEFVDRTCEAARRYIEDFPERPDYEPAFVLVAPRQ